MDFPPVPYSYQIRPSVLEVGIEHTVAAGEVASLDHEVLDNAMESRTFISKAFLASSKSTV